MKLLANKILSLQHGDERLRYVADKLRLPAKDNHIGLDQAFLPAVDRFIFDEGFLQEAIEVYVDHGEMTAPAAKPPLPICWIELENHGLLIDGDHFALIYDGRPDCRLICLVIGSVGLLDDSSKEYRSHHKLTERDEIAFAETIARFRVCLAALQSPNVTTTRRILPGEGRSAAHRAFVRRRFQQGRPMFSYNVVELVPPRAALHRGVLKPAEHFEGMRGHFVIAHWRLIGTAIEPYWVWVEGHKRGDESKGFITKERHAKARSLPVRRGFELPPNSGVPGQRLKANRVA